MYAIRSYYVLSREDSRKHYAEGTEFNIGKIEMVANTGTYVDSPFHRFADGIDLAELPLESLADLDGIVVHAQEYGRITSYNVCYTKLLRRFPGSLFSLKCLPRDGAAVLLRVDDDPIQVCQ